MDRTTRICFRTARWTVVGLMLMAAMAAQAADPITVSNAWIRSVAAGQTVSAAYMNIAAAVNIKLLSVETPIAGKSELHQTSYEGGVMKMRPVDKLEIPAGKVGNLEPGGYHVMLMDVKRELKDSEHVPLTLTIQTDQGVTSKITVDAEVRFVPDHKTMKMPSSMSPSMSPSMPMNMPMQKP